MPHRSPGRYLAPLSLVVCAVAVIAIIAGSGKSDETRTPTQATTTTAAQRKAARTYTVRTGDNLSSVAERTGVPVARIQELNPKVDPNALRPGQRLKLAP
jgi:LysM repeat protein